MKQKSKSILIALTLFFSAILVINLAHAYHIFVVENGTQRFGWAPSAFTTDNSGNIPGNTRPGYTGGPYASPNNDATGLLYVIDNVSNGVNCDDTNAYTTEASPFNEVRNALATLEAVAHTTIDLNFVCSSGDMGLASFDNMDDPEIDVFDSSGNLLINGYNEVVFDDTPSGSIFSLLGFDPSVTLGVGIPIDGNGDEYNFDVTTDAQNPISEAYSLINDSPALGANPPDLEGTLVHEFGHTLGLAHPATVLNARGLQAPGNAGLQVINGTNVSLDEVPTMHAFAIGVSNEAKFLVIDDEAALISLYPAGTAAANFGAISGKVTSADGTPLLATSIIAYKENPGDNSRSQEIGVVVGGNPGVSGNSSGNYRIEHVPAGDYILRLIPIDGSVNSASVGVNRMDAYLEDLVPIGGPFDFEEQFFREVFDPLAVTLDENQAQLVTVIAGQENTNNDFTQVLITNGFNNNAGASGFNGLAVPVQLGDSGGCNALSAPVSTVNALGQLFFLLAPLGFNALWKRKKYTFQK
jgi:hypothetical protein